jgi:D-alanine-D-alanine ligase
MSFTDPKGPILVLYSVDVERSLGPDPEAIRAVLESVNAIGDALARKGAEVLTRAVEDAPSILRVLEEVKPRGVFNLIESLLGRAVLESAAAWMLDHAAVPYTGAAAFTLGLCQRKAITKHVLDAAGLPTARGCTLELGFDRNVALALLERLTYPCIVKPGCDDGSVGLDNSSIVSSPGAALERARELLSKVEGEALVEEFVSGTELNVAIHGDGDDIHPLPLSMIDFKLPPGFAPIVTYAGKWVPESTEYQGTQVVCPAPIPDDIAERVRAVALAAYRTVGLRDYGRVDMRLTTTNEPRILEVNPNPDLDPQAGYARSARHHGWDYDELILRIVQSAEARWDRDARAHAR